MQTPMLFVVAALALCAGGCAATKTESKPAGPVALSPQGWVRHVVLFKFKDDAKPEDVKKIEAAFAALPRQIAVIQAFEWGTNISPEGLNDGLTHAFFVTFASEADRDAYIKHPAHKAFVELLKPSLEKATVVDYFAKY